MPISFLTVQLIQQTTILLSLTFLYGLIEPRLMRLPQLGLKVAQGVLFGGCGIINMFVTLQVEPSFFLDGRSIIVGLAGMYGGVIPGLIAAALVMLYRLSLGSTLETLPGLAAILTSAALGSALHSLNQRRSLSLNGWALFALGVVIAVQRLAWVALLSGAPGQRALAEVAFPVLLIYPLGTLAIGLLLLRGYRLVATQQTLQESEARYRSLVTSMVEGLVLQGADGSIRACNPRATEILGLTADQMQGRTSVDPRWRAIHKDGRSYPGETHPAMLALQTGQPQRNVTMGVYKPDGHLTWISINSQPLFHPGEAAPYAVVTTFSDITVIINVETALAEKHHLLRTLIDHLPDFVYVKDRDSRFVMDNLPHARSLGAASPEEVVGKNDFDFFAPDQAAEYLADEQSVLASGQPMIDKEERSFSPQREAIWVSTTKVPLRDDQGGVIGIVGITHDISAQKELKQKQFELELERERGKVLHGFISSASHDFRTPLSVIVTTTYLLRKTLDRQQTLEKLDVLDAQTNRLRGLLDDFLAVARLDGSISLNNSPVNVGLVLRGLIAQKQPHTQAKQQELSLLIEDDHASIMGSVTDLVDACSHILDNAITYTGEQGEIRVRLSGSADRVTIAVADTGRGIAEADLPHIFDHFYRAEEFRSAQTGGAGLGLTLARKIIQLHGGSISVASQPGLGTTFTIDLPRLA